MGWHDKFHLSHEVLHNVGDSAFRLDTDNKNLPSFIFSFNMTLGHIRLNNTGDLGSNLADRVCHDLRHRISWDAEEHLSARIELSFTFHLLSQTF